MVLALCQTRRAEQKKIFFCRISFVETLLSAVTCLWSNRKSRQQITIGKRLIFSTYYSRGCMSLFPCLSSTYFHLRDHCSPSPRGMLLGPLLFFGPTYLLDKHRSYIIFPISVQTLRLGPLYLSKFFCMLYGGHCHKPLFF